MVDSELQDTWWGISGGRFAHKIVYVGGSCVRFDDGWRGPVVSKLHLEDHYIPLDNSEVVKRMLKNG